MITGGPALEERKGPLSMDVQPQDQDLELARSISREARADPSSPYACKYIGILNGKIVVVADSPEEGLQELRRIEPDRGKGLLVDTSVDHDAVHEIWAG
jgi:hypothetical protein